MILRRAGNKSKIAADIQKQFPTHKIYGELFFGAGGMYFNKPKAKYNILNDLDSDVFNLFQVVSNNKSELESIIDIMPLHQDLLEYWKKNKETDPIKRAVRFVFISNFTFMCNGASMVFGAENPKAVFFQNLNKTFELIKDAQFSNVDFREYFKILRGKNSAETFLYCDPPYIGTWDNYSNSFTEKDSTDLFDCLQNSNCKWAMSEFDNEFIINQAKERNLNIITIGERGNLKNFRTEILVTNYKNHATLFDF